MQKYLELLQNTCNTIIVIGYVVMFKNLVKQLRERKTEMSCFPMTSPLEEKTRKIFLKGLSEHALKLYEKKSDIKKFTKLALSNPENDDYKELIEKLFDLSDNEKFMRDLGI